jgi:hypothetical protein
MSYLMEGESAREVEIQHRSLEVEDRRAGGRSHAS